MVCVEKGTKIEGKIKGEMVGKRKKLEKNQDGEGVMVDSLELLVAATA